MNEYILTHVIFMFGNCMGVILFSIQFKIPPRFIIYAILGGPLTWLYGVYHLIKVLAICFRFDDWDALVNAVEEIDRKYARKSGIPPNPNPPPVPPRNERRRE